jgi:uncharacterized membrane protein (TIGR02234 family)
MAEPDERAERADAAAGDRGRRTFGPVVLLGLASGALAALAGSKPWVTGESGGVDTSAGEAMTSVLRLDSVRESPLAAALALAVLACWGVLLVTRGRFRRAVAGLALVAAVGLLIATVEAYWSLPDKLADSLLEVSGTDTVTTSLTGWYAAGLAGAALSVVATLAAVRFAPAWPEMGTKYDAPAGAKSADAEARPTENIDIWKALDEGRDPTA